MKILVQTGKSPLSLVNKPRLNLLSTWRQIELVGKSFQHGLFYRLHCDCFFLPQYSTSPTGRVKWEREVSSLGDWGWHPQG